mmetsp:Transcript_7991/g.24582  ORF Transcript_7991/g.24582 Transcript_7991/m.24582 type:complete len:202 (+) Transcript_7991:263-868(+)
MRHEAHVGTVDPHAKGDSRHYAYRLASDEVTQDGCATLLAHARVVPLHQLHARGVLELSCEPFHVGATACVNDASGAICLLLGDESREMRHRGGVGVGVPRVVAAQILLVEHFVAVIRSVQIHALHEAVAAAQSKAFAQLPLDVLGGGGGKRQHGRLGCQARPPLLSALAEAAQRQVGRPEVVTPLCHAMCLVYGQGQYAV